MDETPPAPVTYDDLLELAGNLRWVWHLDVRRLFARLFSEASPAQLEWPHRLLREAGAPRVMGRLDADRDLSAFARSVVDDLADYLGHAPSTWYPTTHVTAGHLEVAYFAAEFALTDSLPIFAGGLGAIAGEQLKSASALGVPLVGVSLLYKETSHQWLDEEGIQQESWEVLEPAQLPIHLVENTDGKAVLVRVPFPGREVLVQIWRAPVGRRTLYLLDTDIEGNLISDRGITARLYGGGLETRIQQELVLGVGGHRALRLLGHEANVLHLNEGHTAFAILEHVAQHATRHQLDFDAARCAAAAGLLFTTHTPVAAGHDYFPRELASEYLEPYARMLGIALEDLLGLGRYRPDDTSDTFCPTVFALRMTDAHNGVSRLHGRVTREQWGGLWPRLPVDEVPIGHVTNGVHLQSWITPEIDRLLDRQLGDQWRRVPGGRETWAAMLDADDVELWESASAARGRLVDAVRSRRRALVTHRDGGAADLVAADRLLDPAALTIGFVGRFVAYKRPTLFLRDPDRLAAILSDAQRPVQIVFAGKAHPNDEHGKQLLRSVAEFARERGLEERLVFIEDFDLTADRALAQGVDVWLNTPRRPLEACGIGGMKAGINAALNLSTLDGWWDEVWNDADPREAPIGWCIGTAENFDDHSIQDALDADSFYERLERDIIPIFYERDERDVPVRWLDSVRQSMATLSETWRSHRMVQQYVEGYYIPAASRASRLVEDGARRARKLAADLARIERGWDSLSVRVRRVEPLDAHSVSVTIVVRPGPLGAGDLLVHLWVAPDGMPAFPVDAAAIHVNGDGASELEYRAVVRTDPVIATRFAARVLASVPDAPTHFLARLICWSD